MLFSPFKILGSASKAKKCKITLDPEAHPYI